MKHPWGVGETNHKHKAATHQLLSHKRQGVWVSNCGEERREGRGKEGGKRKVGGTQGLYKTQSRHPTASFLFSRHLDILRTTSNLLCSQSSFSITQYIFHKFWSFLWKLPSSCTYSKTTWTWCFHQNEPLLSPGYLMETCHWHTNLTPMLLQPGQRTPQWPMGNIPNSLEVHLTRLVHTTVNM